MGLSSFNRMRRQLEGVKKDKEIILKDKTFNELRLLAKDLDMENYGSLNKEQLIEAIKTHTSKEQVNEDVETGQA
jgi:Rho termination factor, N-terminal domain